MTVVSKLFNIVSPHMAVFGEKDYQQIAIIKQMVKDLNFDISVIGCPTVREPDGLAMSSRNARLSKNQREYALSLIKVIKKVQTLLKNGETNSNKLIRHAVDLVNSQPGADIDYINICDPETLDDISVIDRPAILALAVRIGEVRLIDNMIISPND